MRQSQSTLLARAERDLARAEANLSRVKQYEPGLVTDRYQIAEMVERANDRVFELRARVNVRRQAVAREAERAGR